MSDDVRERIGTMLRRLREERGYTLDETSRLTRDIDWPISRSRLSQLERGEVEVHLTDLYPLSRTYGFSIGSLVSEAVIAHSRKKFAKGLSADELFEKAKELFRTGKPLEAAWAFDEAGRRAEDGRSDFRHLCMISAGHCYEKLEALDLALSRVECVVDVADRESDEYSRAAAKALMLHARMKTHGRARLYLDVIDRRLEKRCRPDLKALLISARGEFLYQTDSTASASKEMSRAARLYLKLGNHAMAAKLHGVAARYKLRLEIPDAKSAKSLAQTGLALLHESGHLEARLAVLLPLGEAHFRLGEYLEAGRALQEAATSASRLGFREEHGRAIALLDRTCRLVEDEDLARRWKRSVREKRPSNRSAQLFAELPRGLGDPS